MTENRKKDIVFLWIATKFFPKFLAMTDERQRTKRQQKNAMTENRKKDIIFFMDCHEIFPKFLAMTDERQRQKDNKKMQ
jgi:hypothetical protein